jgi:hypothetical protein
LLDALAADPERVAAAYGKHTGQCCFCGSALSDGRSVAVGYGPICAKHYGMAWGEDTVPTDGEVHLATPVQDALKRAHWLLSEVYAGNQFAPDFMFGELQQLQAALASATSV